MNSYRYFFINSFRNFFTSLSSNSIGMSTRVFFSNTFKVPSSTSSTDSKKAFSKTSLADNAEEACKWTECRINKSLEADRRDCHKKLTHSDNRKSEQEVELDKLFNQTGHEVSWISWPGRMRRLEELRSIRTSNQKKKLIKRLNVGPKIHQE